MALPYFYDGQIRRTISHFERIFSGFKVAIVEEGQDLPRFLTVPVMFGGGSRQAHHIINQNSENTTMSVPRIAVYIESIELAEDRLGYQGNFDTRLTIERKYDPETGQYTDQPGNRYEINRLQFRPLDFNFKVDILTSNLEQKFQLFEQIVMIFNPALEIQKTTNPLDWTAIDTVRLIDINFDEQGIPKGTDDELQVMSMTFKVHSQISPPSRVKRQVLIENIIQQIGRGNSREDIFEWDCGDPPYPDIYDTKITTPENRYISVEGDKIRLLGPCGQELDENGNPFSWPQLIDLYGCLDPVSSRLRLFWHGELERPNEDIVGRITYDQSNPNLLNFFPDLDTLPEMTLDAVNAIINPHEFAPTFNLPLAMVGQRYLLTDELGPDSDLWGVNILAKPGDIIEYDGTEWFVDFNFQNNTTTNYVLDSSTGINYEIDQEGFRELISKIYQQGYWRLQL